MSDFPHIEPGGFTRPDNRYVSAGLIHRGEGLLPARQYFNDAEVSGVVHFYTDTRELIHWYKTEKELEEALDRDGTQQFQHK